MEQTKQPSVTLAITINGLYRQDDKGFWYDLASDKWHTNAYFATAKAQVHADKPLAVIYCDDENVILDTMNVLRDSRDEKKTREYLSALLGKGDEYGLINIHTNFKLSA